MDPKPAETATPAAIEAARSKAFVLYEGQQTPHRSCGICLAETFGLPTRPYQALRRGGISGEGECGAIKAGELVLGELLGDPDPTARVTDALRRGLARYREVWRARLAGHVGPNIVCNTLTAPFADFQSAPRQAFCTRIASEVAAAVATALAEAGVAFSIEPIPGLAPPQAGASPPRTTATTPAPDSTPEMPPETSR